ncbi:MAG: phosphogluconate dehydratase [Proteobacteria bacterium]|nr:phosphogluconate dehydratase [Pseudomonadota bacterium]
MTKLDTRIAAVTNEIARRSGKTREEYLARIAFTRAHHPPRRALSCGNIAHAAAACSVLDKARVAGGEAPNIGIVTAYNDMLSAHQPYETYPALIREAARKKGATAQVAGGVPAMCDGVTQGQPGMEMSLFSRDVIAMATAVSLSHNVFDAGLFLGVCDKIVPGLVIGALTFGHLPAVFVPAGPMPSGLSNDEKVRVRKEYAAGTVGRDALLASEMKSYHAPGTCTFYGTANSNQMMMEFMGLHVPGAAFVPPGTPLRDALTARAVDLALARTKDGLGVGEMIDARSIVNAMIGLNATGGSTNHLIHLVAMARAAGILITLEDFAAIGEAVPLLARVYPNGAADVNQFQAVGGIASVMAELAGAGLLHVDIETVAGHGLADHLREPFMMGRELGWRDAPAAGEHPTIIRTVAAPFEANGGLAVVKGALGTAVVKASAVKPEYRSLTAAAAVFDDPEKVEEAFRAGQLNRDVVVVVRFQGPKANGMPELHSLMPMLGLIQDRGHRVALVTDGRLSGASGKVLSALHVVPEAAMGGPLARLRDGDVVTVDTEAGILTVADAKTFAAREAAVLPLANGPLDLGRDLFASFRAVVQPADQGAASFGTRLLGGN